MTSLRMWWVLRAPSLESFCSRLPKSLPSEWAPAPPVSCVDDGWDCAGWGLPTVSATAASWPGWRLEMLMGHSELKVCLFVRVFSPCCTTPNGDIIFNMMKEVTLRKK